MATKANNDLSNHGVPSATKLDRELTQSELGEFFSAYKNLIIAFLVLLIAGIFGYGIYTNKTLKAHRNLADISYEFTQTTMKELTDKKIKGPAFLDAFNKLAAVVSSDQSLVPIILNSVDELKKQGLDAEALSILRLGEKNFSDANARYFIGLRLATVLDDQGDTQNAVKVLEGLLTSPIKALEGKIYLDLGRHYLKLGNKEKAKVNFNYVVEKIENKDLVKLANLYLLKIL